MPNRNWRIEIVVTVVALLPAVAGRWAFADEKAENAKTEALQQVRESYLAPMLMEGLDPSSPEAKAVVADLDACVADLLATQITEEGAPGFGGWDASMTISSQEISFNGTYFRRTLRLARAWACPASEYHHSAEVATALDRALAFALPMLEQHQRPNNWWAWDIGIPQRLGDTLIFAADALSPSTRQRSVTEQEYLTKKTQLPVRDDANNAWRAFVQARTALVTNNPTYLDMASATMNGLLEEGDAIQPDYSYFFHGDGLNIGYGFSHWDVAGRFGRITDGTSWSLTPESLEKLTDWTNEFFIQNAWHGMWSPWTLGRSRTRPYGIEDGMPIMRPTITMDSMSIVRPMLVMANIASLPQAQRETVMAMALEHQAGPASGCDDPSFYYLREQAGVEGGEPAYGAHYFPYTDYLTARHENWYAAVRMSSTRTKTWYTLHGENPLGHEQAEGSLALMTDPEEFAYDVLVTMPWDHLPGVTRQEGLKRAHDTKGEAGQTGGVAIGDVALASFDYKLTGSSQTLSANKSYLVLPSVVVMMGSDIRSEGSGEVTTTLYTVPKRDGGLLMVNGGAVPWQDMELPIEGDHWFYAGHVGIVPLQAMDHELAVQTISATSSRINTRYTTDETYTNQFATVRVTHGDNPDGGSYAAVLLPGATPQEVASFVETPTIEVLANRANVHAIRTADGTTAAAFFDGEQVSGSVWADGPANLLYKREGEAATVALMVPPGNTFGLGVGRKIWLPGGYDLSELPDEVVDAHVRDGGTSFTLKLKTGNAFEMALPVAPLGPEEHTIDFGSNYDYSAHFYSIPVGGQGFAYDATGIGSDGLPGRLTYTSPGGHAPDVAVYDWIPDDRPGPDDEYDDFSVSVDILFSDVTDTSQFFGIAFNIDSQRGDGTSNHDCLILQLRNVDHGGEPVDQWRIRRGDLEGADWGDDLLERNFPAGSAIPQARDGSGTGWLRLFLDVKNGEDGMAFSARLVDLTTSETIDTWTLEGLDYADDLGGAATIGEIGLLGNDSGGDHSVKIDRFMIRSGALPGDLNGDGMVGSADLDAVRGNWGRSVTPGDRTSGDANDDGRIDSGDLNLVRENWGMDPIAVPEPNLIALFSALLCHKSVTRGRMGGERSLRTRTDSRPESQVLDRQATVIQIATHHE